MTRLVEKLEKTALRYSKVAFSYSVITAFERERLHGRSFPVLAGLLVRLGTAFAANGC